MERLFRRMPLCLHDAGCAGPAVYAADIALWTVAMVTEWATEHKLPIAAPHLTEHAVDGAMMLQLVRASNIYIYYIYLRSTCFCYFFFFFFCNFGLINVSVFLLLLLRASWILTATSHTNRRHRIHAPAHTLTHSLTRPALFSPCWHAVVCGFAFHMFGCVLRDS